MSALKGLEHTGRYFCVRIGKYMLRDWHIYRWTQSRAKSGKVQWHTWKRVI